MPASEALGDYDLQLVDANLRSEALAERKHFGRRSWTSGSEQGIAANILASRLKQLVAAGLLTRNAALPGQSAAYSLTEAGIQVLPVMVALGNQGLAHRTGERRLRGRGTRQYDQQGRR
jgi:DNA-binding HxlR family transcriptional regulator